MTILDDIIAAQSWDNWQQEEGYDGKGTYGQWDICEVLYCKLDWLKEHLETIPDTDGNETEHLDTIRYVQSLLEVLDEQKLRRVIK